MISEGLYILKIKIIGING